MKKAFIVVTLTAVSSLLAVPPQPLVATGAQATTLGIAGRTNATPWVAAHGSFVAVVWGASSEGRTDVFVAVSRDRGTTFDSPVQVNASAGGARLGGELPPRVALVPRDGASDIVVLWTARAAATQILMA